MNLDLIKTIAGFTASFGSGMIVSNIIKFTTPDNINLIKRICIGAGGIAIGGMVSDAANNYISKEIDNVVESVKEYNKEVM